MNQQDKLDAGLRAGFGKGDSHAGPSVLAVIESRLGSETRIYLRDEAWEDTPPLDQPAGAKGSERYQTPGEIARGGMGVIIRSRDRDLGRDVAMKVLHPRHANNKSMVRRFVEEAQIAGQLQHPGILQVYELGLQADQRPYFTMKLIKGRTLPPRALAQDSAAVGRSTPSSESLARQCRQGTRHTWPWSSTRFSRSPSRAVLRTFT